jgi:hypothetical protein
MPTLKRFGATSIRIYADDHNPPHFHIVGPDFQLLVRISDFKITAGVASSSQIEKAMDWAKEHQEMLALKWIELNERN